MECCVLHMERTRSRDLGDDGLEMDDADSIRSHILDQVQIRITGEQFHFQTCRRPWYDSLHHAKSALTFDELSNESLHLRVGVASMPVQCCRGLRGERIIQASATFPRLCNTRISPRLYHLVLLTMLPLTAFLPLLLNVFVSDLTISMWRCL